MGSTLERRFQAEGGWVRGGPGIPVFLLLYTCLPGPLPPPPRAMGKLQALLPACRPGASGGKRCLAGVVVRGALESFKAPLPGWSQADPASFLSS